MKTTEEIQEITKELPIVTKPEITPKIDPEVADGPMRGQSQFKWLTRSLDPTSPTTENNESVRTASRSVTNSDGSTSEILYPTIRQEEDHHGNTNLVQLEDEDAYNRAIAENDYLSFKDSDVSSASEVATQYSTYLSDTIDKNRQDYNLKQQLTQQQRNKELEAKPTQAILPQEVTLKYYALAKEIDDIGNNAKSHDYAKVFISSIEDRTIDFTSEDGKFAEMDVLRTFILPDGKESTLLKELEKRFPNSDPSPGAELIKNYLRDKIDERDSVFKLRDGNIITNTLKVAEGFKTVVGGVGREVKNVIMDTPALVGNIGYSTGEAIADTVSLVAFNPIYDVMTVSNMMSNNMSYADATAQAGVDATAMVEKMFKYSTYAGQKPTPKTVTGEMLAPLGEFGVSMMVGAGIYKWGSQLLNKWTPLLAEAGNLMHKGQKALTTLQKSTQANKKAEKLLAPVIGGTLLQSPENRLIPFLEELGASGETLDYMKDSPDDNEFMKRYKAFLDTSFEATAFSLFMPTLLLMGRTAYNWGKPVSESVMEAKGDALEVGAKFWDKIKYLFPKEESLRKMHPGREAANATPLDDVQKVKANALKEVQTLVSATKDNSLEALIKAKGFKVDERGLVVQDNLVTRTPPPDLKNFDLVIVGDEKLHYKKLTAEQREVVATEALKSIDDFSAVSQDIFNVSRIDSEHAAHKYIEKAAYILDSVMKQGSKSNKETVAEGEKITRQLTAWIGEENIGAYLEKLGDISTSLPAHMAATRQYLFEETKHFIKASDKITKLKKPSKQEQVEYFLDLFKYLRAMETDVKIAGNIARTLESRKNILAAPEAVLETIIDGLSAGGKNGPENILGIAEIISHQSDPLAVANIIKRKGPLYNLFETIKSGAISGMLSNAMTQTAANLGIMSYAVTTQFENVFSASLNLMTREFKTRTGQIFGKEQTWLGQGHGLSFKAVNASNFGLAQSLLEIYAGAHFGRRSPVGSALKAGKTLLGNTHELADQFKGAGQTINLPWVGEVALSRGLTADVFGDYLDTAFMKGDIGSVMKLMVNSAGLIQSAAGRAIVMTDGFWRNILERMELHKLSYVEATNIERKLASSEGRELTDDAIQATYMNLIRNPDPKLIQSARDGATTGLMQENPGKYIKEVERYKNATSDYRGDKPWKVNDQGSKFKNFIQSARNSGENVGKGVVNAVDNTARSFVASKFSFIRTMTNIYKQYVWERGPLKFMRLANPENYKKFMTNEFYRQETIAKIGSGSMITWLGYSVGGKLKNKGAEWFMEGVDAGDPKTRYVEQATGTRSPEIKYRDENGDIYSIPLDRLDPLKASMSLGAIAGSYMDYMEEATGLMEEGLQQDAIDMKEELNQKLFYALGEWVMDVPMMQGVKDTAGNFIPGISPYGPDPQKEATKFLNNFIAPWISNYSSLRKAGKMIYSPYTAVSQKSEKYKTVEPIKNKAYLDRKGGVRPDNRPKAHKKRDFLKKVMDEFREAAFKVAFMDRSGDSIRNPKVGQLLYGLVGPEGNLVKFLPDTALDSIIRGLKTLAIPVFGRKQVRTNTSDLILGLRIDYPDPRKWTIADGVVLNAEQRYAWTVETGRLNKKLFSNSYFSGHVESVNNGAINLPQNRMIKARLQKEVQARILYNRERALKIITTLTKYPRNEELLKQIRQTGRQSFLK